MNIDITDDNSSDALSAETEVGHIPTSTTPPDNNITFRRLWERLHPGSISNLCSATLGAGALSLPFAISLTGIVLGVFLLIFSAILTIYSIDVIIDACVRTKLFKYEDVSRRLVGRSAARLLEASILIFCFGVRFH
jgi:amino acid permease